MGLGWIVKRMGVDMVLEEEVVVVGLASKGARLERTIQRRRWQ